jgi:hypothetical protein
MSSKKVTKVILLESAEIDFQLFAEYYETQQSGLGERFIIEFTNQLEYVKQFPSSFQYKFKRFRVAHLPVFPCIIVYKVIHASIVVHAVMHNRQNPLRLLKMK